MWVVLLGLLVVLCVCLHCFVCMLVLLRTCLYCWVCLFVLLGVHACTATASGWHFNAVDAHSGLP